MTAAESAPAVALLDVNVLIALHDAQHVHHRDAQSWFLAHADAGWASCPLTQNGFVRVISQPAYPNALTVGAAARLLRLSCAASVHRFWPDDLSVLDDGKVDLGRVHGHRQLTDVYLLALAVAHGGRFVTFDGRVPLAAVRGAERRHLVAM